MKSTYRSHLRTENKGGTILKCPSVVTTTGQKVVSQARPDINTNLFH